MPSNPEAIAQLARLLGDAGLRTASADKLRDAVEAGLGSLADGLLGEAAASDDVTNRETAIAFLQDRLEFLGRLLGDSQRARLNAILNDKVAAW